MKPAVLTSALSAALALYLTGNPFAPFVVAGMLILLASALGVAEALWIGLREIVLDLLGIRSRPPQR